MLDDNAKYVAQRFKECYETLQRLPGGVNLGCRSFWPDIRYEARELARQEQRPAKLRATPEQITRAEQTLEWIKLVSQGSRELIWMRAEGRPWRVIASITGIPKTTVQRYWVQALVNIAKHIQVE